jgi:biopolymer transport protein ExbD
MAGFAGSDDDELVSGINVTPLVDVVLVLLVIFMMTAPVIYQSTIKVQLPKAKSGEQQGEKNPLQFSLTKEGSLLWDQTQVTWEALEQRLAGMGVLAEQTALISADEATPHGVVIKLMDALRKAGLTKFALNVDGSGK